MSYLNIEEIPDIVEPPENLAGVPVVEGQNLIKRYVFEAYGPENDGRLLEIVQKADPAEIGNVELRLYLYQQKYRELLNDAQQELFGRVMEGEEPIADKQSEIILAMATTYVAIINTQPNSKPFYNLIARLSAFCRLASYLDPNNQRNLEFYSNFIASQIPTIDEVVTAST